MSDRLDHPILLIVRYLRHQPEVEDRQLPLGCPQHVPRVWVRVEEAAFEQLREVGDHANSHQLLHVVRLALAELHAFNPLGHVDSTGRELRVDAGNDNLRDILHDLLEVLPVLALQHVVQLPVKPRCELIEEREEVGSAELEAVSELRGFTHEVEVERHCLQHKRSLHLHRHRRAILPQHAAVDLPKGGGGDRLRGELGEDVGDPHPQLALHCPHRQVVVKRGDLVAETLQLVHGLRGKDVRPDRQRLSQLDEERPEGSQDLS
mmetsp:Transcript_11292/g.38567  ORF Transcript_11292/g.38567 Transcript_11292/m.38567 type:complete len:263 (+) Transcript_11292:2706-3494(+)